MKMLLAQTLRKESEMASDPTPLRKKRHHGEPCWFTQWYDDGKKRRDKWFGKVSEVSEREARAQFNIWCGKWRSEDRVKNPKATQFTYTCTDLATDYLAHARRTFIKHGKMTSHVWEVAYAMQAIMDTFGKLPASDVEAPDLAALRDAMIYGRAGDDAAARSVRTVNGRLTAIKQAYAWARQKGLVTREALTDVMVVQPLVVGRCEATGPGEIAPVSADVVAATKAKCASPVAAMIELSWLTGMRPGEVILMRPVDIEVTEDVWLYYPSVHKMEHKDKQRIVALGPKAQDILRGFIDRPADAYLFSPAEAQAERSARRRATRKTQPFKSWYKAPAKDATKRLGDVYTESAYRKAIHHACRLAWPFPGRLPAKKLTALTPALQAKYAAERKAWEDAHRWQPNQLRHAAATRMNTQFGLEDVSVNLGHSDLRTTRIYALPDVSKAVEIARKVG
jgi:integrase